MKKQILSILILSILLISCKEKAKQEKNAAEAKTEVQGIADANYTANTETSLLNWKGFKPTGTHNGTVAIKNGTLEVKGGKLVGGNFVFDMTTITVLDIPADDEYNAKLKGHLENGDFFNIENNPTATFEIIEVTQNENTLIKGNLTVKGITKSIEFPATLKNTATGIQLSGAPFEIDRTEFDIKYKSKKFFENIKDKFINDEFEISFEVNASK